MPYSLSLTDAGTPGLNSWDEGWVAYDSATDLDLETKLTLDAYITLDASAPSGRCNLISSQWADDSYQDRHFVVGYEANAGAGSGARLSLKRHVSDGGMLTPDDSVPLGVGFHLMVTWNFDTEEIVVSVNGAEVHSDSLAGFGGSFHNSFGQGQIVVGAPNAGTEARPFKVDYARLWIGTAATSGQATEYGGGFRVDSGTLGTPEHLFDFENALTDTGSSAYTVSYSQNIAYATDGLHPSEPACSSLTFADSVEAEDASWVVYATIEGIGETAGLGEYDQLYRFCSTVPHFAEGDPLWLPWLGDWPDILAEDAPRDDGGVVGAGELTLSLVDIDDRLTALFATEADPVTYATEALPVGNNTFDVADPSGIAVGDILYMGSEAMFVEAVTGNELNVARGVLDTTTVDHDAGAPVFNRLPYLLSRRIRLYLVPSDSCDGSEAVEIGQYKIDQRDMDETLGKYIVRGPSAIVFASALCNRREPARFDVTAVYESGKVSVRPKTLGQEYPSIPLWDASEKQAYVRVGDEIAIAENVSASDTYPIFNLVDRAVSGSVYNEGWLDIRELEVAFGALPEATGSGALPSFFRFADGPTPASVRNNTWEPSAHWVDLILNLLTSSAADEDGLELNNRVAAYGAWDCLPPGLGIGQRAALVDFASALSIKYRTPDYLFPNFVLPREPVTFGELITEEFLRPIGAYLITTGGQARIVMPRIPIPSDTSFTIGTADIVTERVGDRLYSMGVRVKQDMSTLVSSLVYRFGRGDLAPTLTVNDSDFDRTYGSKGHRESEARRREVTVPSVKPDAEGMVDFLRYRAMAVLARKRWPATTLSYRTSGLARWGADVGDIGEVTHGQIPDLSTGTRGVTGLQVELRSKKVQVEPNSVCIDHVVRVERRGRYGLIAPCARIVSVAADGASRVITVTANHFTESNADEAGLPDTDAEAFVVGDKVELHERDGTRHAGSTSSTITAVGTNAITVSSDFGGALDTGTTDAGLLLKLREFAFTTAAAEEDYVYLADSSTRLIDNLESSPKMYAEP